MTKKILLVFIVINIVCVYCYCQPILNDSTDTIRNLKVLSSAYEDNQEIIGYSYDSQNRIISIKMLSSSVIIDWTRYYDGEVLIDYKSDDVHEYAKFILDNFGRAVRSTISNKYGVLVSDEFSYDPQGYLRSIKDSIHYSNSLIETKLAYIDGGLSSITVAKKDSEFDEYTAFINGPKGKFGTYNINWLFGVGNSSPYDIISYASNIGILGRSIERLPINIHYYCKDSDEIESQDGFVTYDFDENDYLQTAIFMPDGGESAKISFFWE